MKQQLLKALDLVAGDTWPKRRRVVYIALVFCALVIAYCLGAATAAKDMAVIQAAAESAFWLGGSIIFAYVFGAYLDDRDKRKHMPKIEQTPTEGGE